VHAKRAATIMRGYRHALATAACRHLALAKAFTIHCAEMLCLGRNFEISTEILTEISKTKTEKTALTLWWAGVLPFALTAFVIQDLLRHTLLLSSIIQALPCRRSQIVAQPVIRLRVLLSPL
jgi:hypothetical protein